MADIFISYSQKEPEPTKALAADLEALGLTTWWDTSLLPGDRFPEKIQRELEAAKAVIVIWGEHSAKSEWVYSEAQKAQGMGKLITVHVPGFDLKKVPMPFNGRNSEPVTNRAKIYAALATYGVKACTERHEQEARANADAETRRKAEAERLAQQQRAEAASGKRGNVSKQNGLGGSDWPKMRRTAGRSIPRHLRSRQWVSLVGCEALSGIAMRTMRFRSFSLSSSELLGWRSFLAPAAQKSQLYYLL